MTALETIIYPFETRNRYYFYDINKNAILEIQKEIYAKLRQLSESDFPLSLDDEFQNWVEKMKSTGFLSSNKIKEIVHPDDVVLEYYLENSVAKLTLQITQQCNFRCEYCIYSGNYRNREHSSKVMSIDTAFRAIDFFIAHSKNSKEINLGFYGGEPLLEFEMIKQCIEYIEIHGEGKDISYSITTNGTLITREIIEYFVEHNVQLTISLDGPKEIHDMRRKFAYGDDSTYENIIKSLGMIKTNFPDYFDKLLFNIVLCNANEFSCIDKFFLSNELIKNSYLNASMVAEEYSKERVTCNDAFYMQRDYEYFKVLLSKLNRLDKKHTSKIAVKIYDNLAKIHKQMKNNFKLPEKFHHGGPCIPGARRLFVNADGKFFPCERVSEASDVMGIGDINTGFDIEKARKILNIGKLTEEQCKECWALTYCSQCAGKADNMKEFSREMKLVECKKVKANVRESFKDYCVLKEFGHDFDEESKGLLTGEALYE